MMFTSLYDTSNPLTVSQVDRKAKMKLIILAVFVACSYGAKLNRGYLPPNHAQTSGPSSDILQTPLIGTASYNELRNQGNSYKNDEKTNNNTNDGSSLLNEDHYQTDIFGSYERPRAALDRNAAIIRQVNENNGETFSYAFETENGIVAEENGVATDGVEAQGGYSYTGDDGQVYSVRYTAGHNGFVPEGDHLPTPPPIPEEILKALEQNARDEAAGIYDDGSYSEKKYTSGDSAYQTSNFGQFDVSSDVINNSNDDSVVVNSARNPEAFQRGTGFNNVASSFSDISGISKAYLPPTVQRSPGNRYLVPELDNNNHRLSYNSRTGYNY